MLFYCQVSEIQHASEQEGMKVSLAVAEEFQPNESVLVPESYKHSHTAGMGNTIGGIRLWYLYFYNELLRNGHAKIPALYIVIVFAVEQFFSVRVEQPE